MSSVNLRPDTAIANVGMGEFRLAREIISEDEEDVWQEVRRTNGTMLHVPLPSDLFEYHPGHDHMHIIDWVQLRLLDPAVACNADSSDRPSWCEIVQGEKLSFCIMDYHDFDMEIQDNYGGNSHGYGPPCGDLAQGLTPGFKDTYVNTLEGQAIRLGSPDGTGNIVPAGNYFLEAQWDPNGTFAEHALLRPNSSSSARISVTIPTFTTSTSDVGNPNCNTFTDCLGFPNVFLGDFAFCKDHLRCNSDADCLHGLTCKEVYGEEDRFCQT